MSHPLSFWDGVQLTLLRWFSLALGLMDALLKVRWGERTIERMSRRWQAQLDRVLESLADLERERGLVQQQMDALALQAATSYLGERMLARGELRFDPADPCDEQILDATINLLVAQRLAAVELQEVQPGQYVYRLEPDWAAIRARLAAAQEHASPEVANWLAEGIRYVDGGLLAKPQA